MNWGQKILAPESSPHYVNASQKGKPSKKYGPKVSVI